MKTLKILYPVALLIFVFYSCNGSSSESKVSNEGNLQSEAQWHPLFNHQNLDGWEVLPGGKWEVRDGMIVGTSPSEEPLHGILLSNKTYGDFKLHGGMEMDVWFKDILIIENGDVEDSGT